MSVPHPARDTTLPRPFDAVRSRVSQRGTRGFTLVELIVVVFIIAGLAALAVTLLLNQRDKAEEGRSSSDATAAGRIMLTAASTGAAVTYTPTTVSTDASSASGEQSITVAGELTATFPSGSTPAAGDCIAITLSQSSMSYCLPDETGAGGGLQNGNAVSGELGGGGGTDGGGGPALVFSVSYPTSQFTTGSNQQALAPTIENASGTVTFAVDGTLPPGVSFNSSTGEFTGPSANAWNFQSVQISQGQRRSCAVGTDGGVRCWGADYGATPVVIPGLESGMKFVSVGRGHYCAMSTANIPYCWGANAYGQVGNGSFVAPTAPTTPVGLESGVLSISAGRLHTCAVALDGSGRCWGRNHVGQVGIGGGSANYNTPQTVVGLSSGATSVSTSATSDHSCAITESSSLKCWGYNFYGQLGNGTTVTSAAAVDVAGMASGVTSASTGESETCALTLTGSVLCWGRNYGGQLGDGTAANRSTPVNVIGLGSGVVQMSRAATHGCALMDTGVVRCWGRNLEGQNGTGTAGGSHTASTVATAVPEGPSSVSTDSFSACATYATGHAICWGENTLGNLGNGTSVNSPVPVNVLYTGPQTGFPATVTVTATDSGGASSQASVTLTLS